eukprot:CAMPEP_0172445778 /NCGR_PEP_ID=MMETSP1065-20121228/5572_1 /TAXON_ID=265537 /ORGANISM="Amphiprora paludosa, Strain CCMP125" /LENGTH=76 /DNA_ID=CAMNT_0013196757 /DNA_START=1311 /DNA_END=1541 /DNA_ORIENTATION=-
MVETGESRLENGFSGIKKRITTDDRRVGRAIPPNMVVLEEIYTNKGLDGIGHEINVSATPAINYLMSELAHGVHWM